MPEDHRIPLLGAYWVQPGRFLAGVDPGDLDPELTRSRLRNLVSAGVRTFIDLTEADEPLRSAKGGTSYYSVLREICTAESMPITYVNFPLQDGGVPSPWTVRCILDVIDRSIADDNPVYLHCWAGRGRTGTVVGCYLKRHGLAEDADVLQELSALRRGTRDAAAPSPQTKEQVRLVTTWKKGA
jgi:hypothetical protein